MWTILLIVLWIKGTTITPEPHPVLIPPGQECNEAVAKEVFQVILDHTPDKALYLSDDFAWLCTGAPEAPSGKHIPGKDEA